MAITSPIAPAIAVEGLLLQVGNASSPETMQTIANATDLSLPIMTDVVDVTNVGDSWKRRIPTLHDMGKISFKIFWVMEEVTHRNSANGGSVGAGLRYLLVHSSLRDFAFVYPDGNNSTDAFPAYVTSFSITGKVGGVFEAAIELSNSGEPSLV
jgi:hypothetical protein